MIPDLMTPDNTLYNTAYPCFILYSEEALGILQSY